jgi:amino acid permease
MLLSRRFWVLGAVLAVLPVSFYRTLDELKKASALALIFVFMLAFGIVAYAHGLAGLDPCYGKLELELELEEGDACRGEVLPFTDGPSTLSKLPIFVFAFTCHQNIFPIVNEIQNRTQARLNWVVGASIGLALLLFSVVAIEGYRTYGSNVKGDILLNYPETGNVTFLRICIAFMLALHYPLQLDPSRRCLTSLVKVVNLNLNRGRRQGNNAHDVVVEAINQESGIDGDTEHDGTELAAKMEYSERSNINPGYTAGAAAAPDYYGYGGVDKTPPAVVVVLSRKDKADDITTDTLFYTITIAFLLLSFTVAMVVDDLGVVLAMVGATGSTLVSYVLPGLIYVKIHPEMDLFKIGAYVQLYVGCMIMPVALYFVLKE